ncbi:hypothetical protein ACFWUP_02920 [Nocardia sp. NPDC058658]|uniref:hypothetical protein n=1 Tax=Nocardia sp. NPDC058658 TaxID=3346580 RepID=UPI00365AC665
MPDDPLPHVYLDVDALQGAVVLPGSVVVDATTEPSTFLLVLGRKADRAKSVDQLYTTGRQSRHRFDYFLHFNP